MFQLPKLEQVLEEPLWEALRPYISAAEAPDSAELEQRRQVRATRAVFLMKHEQADGQALVGSPPGLCDHMCKQYTVRAHVFLMLILPACLSQPVVTVLQVTAT